MLNTIDIKKPKIWILGMLLIMALAALVITPFIGSVPLSLEEVFSRDGNTVGHKIFWQMRVPRTLVGFLGGAIFALCGMVFQALFRNPLVAPSTLGVSAGASFGASVYIWLGFGFHVFGISGVSLFAFAGALLSISIVWSLASIRYGSSTAKMLLAGVAVSFFFVSLIMFIQYMSDITQSYRITRWLMGGLFVYGYQPLLDILPFAVIGICVIWYFTQELNLFTISEEVAISRGVDVDLLIKVLFFLISFIVGGIVSVCGPISFVGIMAPHVCRLLVGFDHRSLIPACILFGGLLLTVCDTVARTVVAPTEIPVGIITAMFGGPFFLWLLRERY